MNDKTPFQLAIEDLGGQVKAAEKIGRHQSTISEALRKNRPSAEMCMLIEAATDGRFTAEQLRPSKAAVFAGFRKTSKRRKAAQTEAA
ncbi:MAG: putative antitoxin of bacterial toxin-antitoxin system, YdaS/YdaT [Microvirga sp.]|jgi:DNA-binding transcriptional regulator YdaS (Cro superfamily)|nr:putative antitoxin of bacterial toxin-antitoxin system, YdaS/YdaT [Microvirga sp.]MDF2969578.1 putative antitoxin of bacterial toxin-antitoxin system, YdaS/YdaT [Microvirga sp.]